MSTSLHSGGPLVVLEDVHLTLGSAAGPVNILRGVSLEVGIGETVSIVGPSGSGKSTLMMVLGGLERPSAGRVRIDGMDLGALGEDPLARFRRGRIGIVFQSFHLIPTMTALENVAIPLELNGSRDAFAAAESGLAAVGLGHRLSHYPGQLSGGEQQRVAVARAIAKRPDALMCDGPTVPFITTPARLSWRPSTGRARSLAQRQSSSRMTPPSPAWPTGCCGWAGAASSVLSTTLRDFGPRS